MEGLIQSGGEVVERSLKGGKRRNELNSELCDMGIKVCSEGLKLRRNIDSPVF